MVKGCWQYRICEKVKKNNDFISLTLFFIFSSWMYVGREKTFSKEGLNTYKRFLVMSAGYEKI